MENCILSRQVCTESLIIYDKIAKGRCQQDEDGYYLNIPLAMLNAPSRNHTAYESNSFIKQLTSSESSFYTRLKAGQLYGEYDHPTTLEFSKTDPDYERKILERMMTISGDRRSHHFKDIRAGKPQEDGSIVVYGDLKPIGPKAQYLRETLDEPYVNAAFSLRAITDRIISYNSSYAPAIENVPKDVSKFVTLKLITFDNVDIGGFEIATKINSPSFVKESYQNIKLRPSKLDQLCVEGFKLESLTDQEVNDIFKTNNIYKFKRFHSVITDSNNRIKNIYGEKQFESLALSLF